MTPIEKKRLVSALAQFCAGNQVAKSISLQMCPSIAGYEKDWVAVRGAIPTISGYPTVKEAEEAIEKFLE